MASISNETEKHTRLPSTGNLGALAVELGADIPVFSDGEIVYLGADTSFRQIDDKYAEVMCKSGDPKAKNAGVRRKCAHYVVTRMAQQIGQHGAGAYKLSKKNERGVTFWVVEKVAQ